MGSHLRLGLSLPRKRRGESGASSRRTVFDIFKPSCLAIKTTFLRKRVWDAVPVVRCEKGAPGGPIPSEGGQQDRQGMELIRWKTSTKRLGTNHLQTLQQKKTPKKEKGERVCGRGGDQHSRHFGLSQKQGIKKDSVRIALVPVPGREGTDPHRVVKSGLCRSPKLPSESMPDRYYLCRD